MLKNSNHKITIITVVFNASEGIKKTLKSIFSQSYKNIEIIVIDGGSTDGTIDIISDYSQYIDYFISEQDYGIYDAMNKGIRVATGEWICFMNSGDIFYSKDTVSNIFLDLDQKKDIIIGECIVDFNLFKKRLSLKSLDEIDFGMIFCHQSAFVKTELYQKRNFNLEYKIAADFDFFYWCHTSGIRFTTYDFPFSVVTAGGLSDSMKVKVIMENRKIVKKYSKFSLKKEIIFFFKILLTYLKTLVIRILPKTVALYLKKLK